MNRIRKIFHFHRWKQNRNFSLLADIFPPPGLRLEKLTRKCTICGKEQYWLPGYGGSGFGSWETLRKKEEDV